MNSELFSATDVATEAAVIDAQALWRSAKFAERKTTFVDFFAGSGLVSHALKPMFDCVWANDISPKKASVYCSNHGDQHFSLQSIEAVRGSEIPSASLVWASFPCQDLSLAGAAAGIHAPRSGLVWEWLRTVDEMPDRPKVLVAENVVGLVATAGGQHYRTLHQALCERGYSVGAIVVDASIWLPQSRVRVFVIAVDRDVKIPNVLVSSAPGWLHSDSLRRACAGLQDVIWWNATPPSVIRPKLSDIVEWDAPYPDKEFEARNLALVAPHHRVLLDALPKGTRFVAPGYRRTRNSSQTLELRFDDVAGCLRTPEGGSSRQLLIIRDGDYWRCRLITARETARLMGAPDSYILPPSYNDAYKAMGDAVAVPAVRWLAETFLRQLAH
jgi:DNA (cytosine-5)-methyltransferase 1